MASAPDVEQREAVPYVAVARSGSGDDGFRAAVDGAFPELFGWLSAQGVEPAGPPFIRYVVFEPEGAFEIELGVPVAPGVEAPTDGAVHGGELPAGHYVTYLHVGAYLGTTERWIGRDLTAAYALVETWASERGIAWDATEAAGRTEHRARFERYLVGPPFEDDVEKWQTELLFRIKDGAATAT